MFVHASEWTGARETISDRTWKIQLQIQSKKGLQYHESIMFMARELSLSHHLNNKDQLPCSIRHQSWIPWPKFNWTFRMNVQCESWNFPTACLLKVSNLNNLHVPNVNINRFNAKLLIFEVGLRSPSVFCSVENFKLISQFFSSSFLSLATLVLY